MNNLKCYFGISIPYGSIKRSETVRYTQVNKKFQFLMVQLKEYVANTFEAHTGISIPYGSIKSFLAVRIFRLLFSISIPYGSIKSVSSIDTFADFALFQFLMVQLKEALAMELSALLTISIPYGSIKRKHGWV